MAKKNNKSNNSKKNNKKDIEQLKKANEELVKKQQQQIETNVLKIITQLKIDYKNSFFNSKKKKEIKHMIFEFENYLNLKEYDILSSKMKSLEILYEKEEKDIKILNSNKGHKAEKKQFNLVEFLKTTRYPIVTRVKKIINEEIGSSRIKKLSIVFGIIFLLISVSIIGFLMYFSVIPGISFSSTDTDDIFSIFVFAIPLALLFVI